MTIGVSRECGWTAASQVAWIQITSAASGQGDGSVTFRVAGNPDPVSRHGAMVIADQPTDVSQGAAPCRFDVSGPADAISSAGGQTAIDVRTHDVCAWTASSNAAWVTLNPTSGRGTAQIAVTATPNGGPERIVTLTVAQGQVVLRQASAPAAPPAPAPTPTPTPTPPPPPTQPPPQPTVEIKGKIDHLFGVCPEVWFAVDDRIVKTGADTGYNKKNSCRDLHEDDDVVVRGTVQTLVDRTYVQAQSIDIKK